MDVFRDPRVRRAVPALVASLLLAACGTAGTAKASAHKRTYKVAVSATFPERQRLAQHSRLLITVRNTGTRALPNVAVTVTNPQHPTAQALGTLIPTQKQGRPLLASRSRPIWIIDRAPGPCVYSCHDGGPGGAATAYTDTWALGRLDPGQTKRFAWHVTAIKPGRYRIRYVIAPGLSGNMEAVTARDAKAAGVLRIQVTSRLPSVHVSPSGAVHYG